MAHECPDCGQWCTCDQEDTYFEENEDCTHYLSGECEGYEESEGYDGDEDDCA